MAQESIKIKEHIEAEREKLGHDIQEIELRIKDAVDWRTWYEKNTALLLGAAFAGGLLLSQFGGRDSSPPRPVEAPVKPRQPSRVGEIMDLTASALIGVGANLLQDFLADKIPSFRDHYAEAERSRKG